ncbi:MAG TPA: thioredoxin domain-containing protein [Ferruginibacter sp.]|nr:thioredoxin domain-containing protein [Ferruginibacter sp.]
MSIPNASGKKPNKLIGETSPYLLQHAFNPVNWYPWGEEALQQATIENKVILVSIGYSACHWCHVMERESFEDETVAAFMNKHFINIKIDREERPDLDHIYMDAVQAMTGSGGWPLNVFLTPEKKPFYGGTYFPPVRAHGRSSWIDILTAVNKAWEEKKEDIIEQADNLTGHLRKSNSFGQLFTQPVNQDKTQLEEQLTQVFSNIMKTADRDWGGFGPAPKFPQTGVIRFLLQYYYHTGNNEALTQARLSIDKMLQGGIYDQVGGGLARYSTDTEWLVPHFEKMLYDNALFIIALSDAYRLTQDASYERAIRRTVSFVQSELGNGSGAFYAALDADSEGEEGKYYVWSKAEIVRILGPDANLFCDFFNISETGNWEGKNIPRMLANVNSFAESRQMNAVAIEAMLDKGLEKLHAFRKKRKRPQLDDKIILSWNALMITALAKAGGALGESEYMQAAEKCFGFLIQKFRKNEAAGGFYHTCKKDIAKFPAFLDDYAFLIQASIHMQEVSSDTRFLIWAKELTDHVLTYFADKSTGYFFFTSNDQTDVILRKKEVYDGAMPSANSIMAENLQYLSVVFDKPDWLDLSVKALNGISKAVVEYPTSFSNWCILIMNQLYGYNELVITGFGYKEARQKLLKKYIPARILQTADKENDLFPLLRGKMYGGETWYYLCKNYVCNLPVLTFSELMKMLNTVKNN